jgi:hypothetical protein
MCLAGIGLFAFTDTGDALGISPYYERGASIGMAEADRYRRFSTRAIWFTIQRNGWLGVGAGTGSQGAQYFGGGPQIVGSAAEGGLGKVVAELGVPGLVIVVFLAVALGRHLWRLARLAGRGGGYRRARYAYGLIAFLFANAVMYAVAHQIYGDPLVLYLIGLVLGMALAIPRVREGAPRRAEAVSAREASVRR